MAAPGKPTNAHTSQLRTAGASLDHTGQPKNSCSHVAETVPENVIYGVS